MHNFVFRLQLIKREKLSLGWCGGNGVGLKGRIKCSNDFGFRLCLDDGESTTSPTLMSNNGRRNEACLFPLRILRAEDWEDIYAAFAEGLRLNSMIRSVTFKHKKQYYEHFWDDDSLEECSVAIAAGMSSSSDLWNINFTKIKVRQKCVRYSPEFKTGWRRRGSSENAVAVTEEWAGAKVNEIKR